MVSGVSDRVVKADKHTIFVLGNGPSLSKVDLTGLSDYPTIGLNAAYRYWNTIDWRPRYYACLDIVVGLSHREAIAELICEGRIERFLLRDNLIQALGSVACDPRVLNFDALKAFEPLFACGLVTTGSHAALWGASMGYSQVVLLGIDGRYVEIVQGAEARAGAQLEIVRKAENPNYFFADYQQPGDQYHLPNARPGLHVDAWTEARDVLPGTGASFFNANPNSEVRCFPFVDLDAFLEGETLPVSEAPDGGAAEGAAPRRSAAEPRISLSKILKDKWKDWVLPLAAILFLCGLALGLGDRSAPWRLPAIVLGVFAYGIWFSTWLVRQAVLKHTNALRERVDALEFAARDAQRFLR